MARDWVLILGATEHQSQVERRAVEAPPISSNISIAVLLFGNLTGLEV